MLENLHIRFASTNDWEKVNELALPLLSPGKITNEMNKQDDITILSASLLPDGTYGMEVLYNTPHKLQPMDKTTKAIPVRMMNDRLLVERDETESRTKGGIIIPEGSAEKPQRGKVVAVGEGAWHEEHAKYINNIVVGDNIVFGKYAGSEMKINGKEYIVCRESDVMFTYPDSVEINLSQF